MAAFWRKLRDAVVETGGAMRLADGTCFLGSSQYGGVLFMREDYAGLLGELLKLFAAGTRKVVVTGSPGIGKSWFGFVVLHHIATREPGARVVWQASRKRRRYLFHGDDVREGGLDSFLDALEDASAWFIVDEAERGGIVQAEARMVVLSSPRRDNYKSFLKAVGATIRYMPVWSWGEIEACHALLYADDPKRPLAEVARAYARWGGIPRYVLEKLREEGSQIELDRAISRSTLARLMEAVGDLEGADDASHRVLHFDVKRPYIRTAVVFGSADIASRVLATLEARDRERLAATLLNAAGETTANADACAGLPPLLADAYARRALRAGGAVSVRRVRRQRRQSRRAEGGAGAAAAED